VGLVVVVILLVCFIVPNKSKNSVAYDLNVASKWLAEINKDQEKRNQSPLSASNNVITAPIKANNEEKHKKRASVTFGAVKPTEFFDLLGPIKHNNNNNITTTTPTTNTSISLENETKLNAPNSNVGYAATSTTTATTTTSAPTANTSILTQYTQDDTIVHIQKEISQQSHLISLLNQQLQSLTAFLTQEKSSREQLEADFKSEIEVISKHIELERKERVKLHLILDKINSVPDYTPLQVTEKEKSL